MIAGPAGGRSRWSGPFTPPTGLAGLVAAGAVVAIVAVLGPLIGRAGAHTDLLQGSPGPGQRVGGTVDFVDLVFLAPVTEVVVEIRGPDGQVVASEMQVADGQIIRASIDPLLTPGRYVVDYQMISDDGDFTEAGYFFLYEEGAFEPVRLGRVDLPDDPVFTAQNALAAVAVVVLGGSCLVLLRRLRRSRAALVAHREGREP